MWPVAQFPAPLKDGSCVGCGGGGGRSRSSPRPSGRGCAPSRSGARGTAQSFGFSGARGTARPATAHPHPTTGPRHATPRRGAERRDHSSAYTTVASSWGLDRPR
ncbi:hypothetical protein C6Y14_37295 [Streptomyces dioscori]|uniref:Uncharacterized protein n=1 Tax=Streptomyces dioscori TaxID=2109333 RepID=A0A2P8PWL0_9ACTN|nr:hypothetical protein C6Y14_37295 [Streptomyces dioscori]